MITKRKSVGQEKSVTEAPGFKDNLKELKKMSEGYKIFSNAKNLDKNEHKVLKNLADPHERSRF